MNNTRWLVGFVALLGASLAQAQFISVSHEQNNLQTGAATTVIDQFSFFASVEDYPGVTGGTVTATTGGLTTPGAIVYEGNGLTEYEDHLGSLSTLSASYPLSANYTLGTTGSPATSVTVNGPGNTFAFYNPATVLFSISGVTGTWVGSEFRFNPAGVTSFNLTMNNYAVTNSGGYYGWYMFAGANGSRDSRLGEVGGGPVADSTTFSAPTFLFTAGLSGNAGDSDSTTYGFTAGSRILIEGSFANVLGLTTSEVGDGSQKAFIVGNTTAFTLVAVPEPSTYALWAGSVGLLLAVWRRRRRACPIA